MQTQFLTLSGIVLIKRGAGIHGDLWHIISEICQTRLPHGSELSIMHEAAGHTQKTQNRNILKLLSRIEYK